MYIKKNNRFKKLKLKKRKTPQKQKPNVEAEVCNNNKKCD